MTVTIPKPLEPPPRSTGDPQGDYPLLLNWLYRAYQIISQSVSYINQQTQIPTYSAIDLPDPLTATVSGAQKTANDAYTIANTADTEAKAAQTTANTAQTAASTAQTAANAAQTTANSAVSAAATAQSDITVLDAVRARNISGTVTVSGLSTGATITFPSAQPDTNYTIIIQAYTSAGAPTTDSFVIGTKSYTVNNASFTLRAAPALGNSVSFDWQLIRNT